MLIGWVPTWLIYGAAGFAGGNIWIVPETWIERQIPFSSSGIWLYLMLYVYVPFTFLTVSESKIRRITFVFLATGCISGIIFVLFPSTLAYPTFKADGISAAVLELIYENDTPQNCFPSMHGSLITICTLASWDKNNKALSYGCILLSLLMYFSIIQIRRHLFIDVSAGIVLGALVWWVYGIILTRRKKGVIN